MKFQAIKGVRDILPPESALWNRVEQAARDVFAAYGYGEIRLPIFEQTELFARSVGAETDIVSKEMYTFWDQAELETIQQGVVAFLKSEIRHDREVTRRLAEDDWRLLRDIITRTPLGLVLSLRPEATASVCRAYIEHGMHTLPGDVKLYYIGPMFRRERPQKGRYRQFYQIGAEVLGASDHPAIDAELIEMLLVFFRRVGLAVPMAGESQDETLITRHSSLITLHVNSIGCRDCRPKYVAELKRALEAQRDKLGADSQRRIDTNPLRVLDSKLPEEQAVIDTLPRIADHLCAACRDHFAALQEQLGLRGIGYEINWRLVRGLDYYMRTTFEITAPGLGAQNAVCGGGRYDGLVELLGGPATKGIGFAIGTDRLILSLTETGAAQAKRSLDVFIAWMGAAAYPVAVKLARKLRDAGLAVELPAVEMKFKKALGLADKLGARYALIIGENEVASGKFALKNLADGKQEQLSEEELLVRLGQSG